MKSSETSHGGAEVTLSTEEAGEVIGANLGHVVCFSPPTAQALELVCEAGKFQARSELYPALRFNSSQILSERLPMLEERSHEFATQPVATVGTNVSAVFLNKTKTARKNRLPSASS